jgi:diguanylate cyclase (GGDEF)-like protein
VANNHEEADGLYSVPYLANGGRAGSPLGRDVVARARPEAALGRAARAEHRDRIAEARDAAAAARDRLAAELDAEVERLDARRDGEAGRIDGWKKLLRVAGDRKRAAASRARAAAQRDAAAHDRARSAHDRELAALDRRAAAEELALEGIDPVTGALRRRVGLAAIQREMDRTRRSGERLVVVFLDVDGLKAVNDDHGHLAGDEVLRAVVRCIEAELRSYDVVVRFGGDEFVCCLCGQGADHARQRFGEISERLAAEAGAAFTAGIAERGGDDTLEDLLHRADTALLACRRRRR